MISEKINEEIAAIRTNSGSEASSASGEKKTVDDPAALVSNADESLVRDFLTVVLTENESCRSRFRLLTGEGISEAEVRRYKQRINRIVKNYMGREGFITYDRAGEFEIMPDAFMDEEIMAKVDNGYMEDAFDLTLYIFRMLPDLEIDDSDGELGMLTDSCVQYWNRIAESADEDLQESMFERCTEMLEENGDELDFLEDYVETFPAQAFHTPELRQRKLEYTANMCALFAKPQKPGVTYWSAGIWIERHLDLLEETGASEGGSMHSAGSTGTRSRPDSM